ncbi:MAG: AAA family ATPase, partial [Actinobacteria bacterium]|nr:AAA family ATPase [Actinomycetota bacterium]
MKGFLAGTDRSVLALAGEPGVGKTHLLVRTRELASHSGMTTFFAGCLRVGVQPPYAPLSSALQTWAHQQSPEALRGALAGCGWLLRIVPGLEPYMDELPPAGSLAPDQERHVITGAVARLVRQAAGEQGTLIILDDMQWTAQDTLELLAALLVTEAPSPVRIMLAYRSNEVKAGSPLTGLLVDFAHRGIARHIDLAPLTAEAAHRLLRHLGTPQVESHELDRIVQRTGGVPFYLVSYAQENRYVAAPDHLPWSVSQSILQRLSALSAGAQAVVRVGAVAGRILDPDVLSAVTGLSRSATLSAMDEAEDAGMVVSRDNQFAFSHDVIREVVEAGLSAGHRLEAHEAVAHALERVYATKLTYWYEELAFQYTAARVPEKALEYLLKSAQKALAAGTTTEALRQYAVALEMCDVVEDDSSTRRAEVLGLRGHLFFALGDYASMAADFQTVAQITSVLADDHRLAAARANLGTALLFQHEFVSAEMTLRDALTLAHGRFQDVELRAAASLTDLLYVTGRVTEAKPVFDRVEELAK